ncbi:glycosyltransferase family 15 protein [Gonapodya prolifera JEL478]|uniref:Glycosyltransferase family 15 protein n=1 Tax=Gonapodya prolifera (strain JEL478) TaxID=1344416 RepID=A0A139AR26_GONPJ|nr:glycosyltransferase family 15 protein [Gonapodya prolifera JEL478]|eukprot:KXS19188.1 glycosyltransferase family 15 protein [Gonapodya prolifera JEL478]
MVANRKESRQPPIMARRLIRIGSFLAIAIIVLLYWFWPWYLDETYIASLHAQDIDPWAVENWERLRGTVTPNVSAALIILAMDKDVDDVVDTISVFKNRFLGRVSNHYSWILFNDGHFSSDFRSKTSSAAYPNRVIYADNIAEATGILHPTHQKSIEHLYWGVPSWIDQELMKAKWETMPRERTNRLSYRHMCRFHSGLVYKHPALKGFDYVMRLDSGMLIHCDVDDMLDPFAEMARDNVAYGFGISMTDGMWSIPTLWSTTKAFIAHYNFVNPNDPIPRDKRLLDFISDDGGETFNTCHFWDNFEVVRVEFMQRPEVQEYFEWLDVAGGFFYERWGDAPVHTLCVVLFARHSEVRRLDHIAYTHHPETQCPQDIVTFQKGNCTCNPKKSFNKWWTCGHRWTNN